MSVSDRDVSRYEHRAGHPPNHRRRPRSDCHELPSACFCGLCSAASRSAGWPGWLMVLEAPRPPRARRGGASSPRLGRPAPTRARERASHLDAPAFLDALAQPQTSRRSPHAKVIRHMDTPTSTSWVGTKDDPVQRLSAAGLGHRGSARRDGLYGATSRSNRPCVGPPHTAQVLNSWRANASDTASTLACGSLRPWCHVSCHNQSRKPIFGSCERNSHTYRPAHGRPEPAQSSVASSTGVATRPASSVRDRMPSLR